MVKGVQVLEMQADDSGSTEKYLRFAYYAKDKSEDSWSFKSQTTLIIPIEEGRRIIEFIDELLEKHKVP